jgi:FkbH-like protein
MTTENFKTANGSAGNEALKNLLLNRDENFWRLLAEKSLSAASFNELITLSALRKKAVKIGVEESSSPPSKALRIALIGGSTLFPLSDLVEHLLRVTVGKVEIFVGEYNNYRSEILDQESDLYEFAPDFVIVLPDEQSCKYTGRLNDSAETVTDEINRFGAALLRMCAVVRERAAAEIILCNYILPPFVDLGAYRAKSLASDWNFKKAVNLYLGGKAPNYVHICDLEFLAYRLGGFEAKDEKSWFESKQLCSPALQLALAKEIAHLIGALKNAPKKVLMLDLDNTLWGGVIGDDGMEGIEIGDTSPRGEAFKAFQTYILSLTERGVLLGVCSKNDFENAIEPFRRHPEMVLREEHFVAFKANWKPKAENLIETANELNLGLDSFIFVDDNPAEIEIVRQFAPEVTTILLDEDPSRFVRQLQESRLFERFSITGEDAQRTEQYRKEAERKSLLESAVDMDSYLESLEMIGAFKEFNRLDLPRVAQLINKSNQFNLTTKRRTESEIETLMRDPRYAGFSMRLRDRFGDHGLISVVICFVGERNVLEIDTWLMSCRVLKRQVEEQVLNEIVRLARAKGCERIGGLYLPTAKNGMVKDLYSRLGFRTVNASENCSEFELSVDGFKPLKTFIFTESRLNQDEHYTSRSINAAAINI